MLRTSCHSARSWLGRAALLLVILPGESGAATPEARTRESRAFLERAWSLQYAGKPDSARVMAEEALRRAERIRPSRPALNSEILARLAHILCDLGDFKAARTRAEAALAAARGAGAGVDSLVLAGAEGVLGRVLLRANDRDGARRHLAAAVGIRERRQGADHIDLVPVLQQMATWHGLRGDLPAANATIDRAIAIIDKSGATDPVLLGTVFGQASNLRSRGENYVEAVRFARLSLAAREAAYGLEHRLTVQSIISLSAAQGHLGDLAEAASNGERAVAILRKTVGPATEDLAFGLSNLGSVYLAGREWRRAAEQFREAATIRERLYGPRSGPVLYLWSCLADAQVHLGDLAGAARTYQRVAASQAEDDPENYVPTLLSMAVIEFRRDRLDSCLALVDRAVALCDTLVGPGTDHSRDARRLRIDLLDRMGRRREALDGALSLERDERERLWLTAYRLSEREATASLAIRVRALDRALAMAADTEGLAPAELARVWDEVIQSRSIVFDVLAERRRRLRQAGPEIARLTARVDSARAALAAHLIAPRPAGSAAVWQVRQERLREFLDEAERAVGERSADFSSGRERSGAGFAAIARAIPAAGRLVSFVRYNAAPVADVSPDERYLALVTAKSGGRIEVVPLGPADSLDAAIERWRALAGRPPARDPVERAHSERDLLAAGQVVRRAVWDRLAPHLEGASAVYMVPDGALIQLNPAALPDGRGRCLVESGPLLALLTTERDLLPEQPDHGGGLLVVGGPDFDSGAGTGAASTDAASLAAEFRSAVTDAGRIQLGPLPGAAAEAREIGELWRKYDPAANVRLLTGGAATETAVARGAAGVRTIHLATHGFVLGLPTGGADESTPPGTTRGVAGVVSAAGPRPRPRPGSTPLSICGLAMAGANRAGAGGPDDGYLTGAEISALPLHGTEWAVLSACRTGIADLDQPENVQGLHRALRLAGVRTVIMSLWPVDDETTREWMRALYRARLADRASTPRAVQSAERAVLAARRARGESTAPFFWAPFIAVGDPR